MLIKTKYLCGFLCDYCPTQEKSPSMITDWKIQCILRSVFCSFQEEGNGLEGVFFVNPTMFTNGSKNTRQVQGSEDERTSLLATGIVKSRLRKDDWVQRTDG